MTTIDARCQSESVSATGGSARSQAEKLNERSWKPRLCASVLVVCLAFALPLLAAVAAVQSSARIIDKPGTVPALVLWLVLLGVIATAAMRVTDRFTRRLLPLAAMLRLSLVFPDRVPSRFSIALKTGSGRALERALDRGETDTRFSTDEPTAALVIGLLQAINAHDRLTRGHSERVRAYADLIAEELQLDQESRNKLHWAALLHDVGKLDVPAEILNKKGRLTPDEWQIIRGHPGASEKRLEPVLGWLGEWARAATEHHERFDGDGYPSGLRREEISLAGRIVAVADAFDVMTASRSYKKPLPAVQARVEVAQNAGTQFDPRVVRAFLAISVGRLRMVMGPLAWLSGLSGLLSIGSISSSATAAVVAATAATGLAVPPTTHKNNEPRQTVAVTKTVARANPPESVVTVPPGLPIIARHAPAQDTANPDPARPDRMPASMTTTPSTTAADVMTTTPSSSPPPETTPVRSILPPGPAPISKPPIAHDDFSSAVLTDRVRVDVLGNDSDPDGNLDKDSLKVISIAGSDYKSVQISSNEIDVRLTMLKVSTLKITYQVCDTTDLCAQAILTVSFIL
jgi:HD-GYP domain-containing protein (c-di-GMP phosphodiesterase class II)